MTPLSLIFFSVPVSRSGVNASLSCAAAVRAMQSDSAQAASARYRVANMGNLIIEREDAGRHRPVAGAGIPAVVIKPAPEPGTTKLPPPFLLRRARPRHLP